jgi:NADPH2:quinone reductase
MRAAVVHELGATPAVQERPEPDRGKGQALVEMGAVGLNPVDLAITGGTFYGGHPPLPFTAGREGVGRVLEADSLAAGTRVYARTVASGSLAERFVADEAETWELPDGDDDPVAAALGIAGMAGWVAVEERGRLRPGESVLVLGATGVVGSVALQAARILGAARVVAAGRDPERLERARQLGADEVIVLGDDLEGAIRAAFPEGGPDLVIDPLWGAPALAAIAAAPVGMRLVNLGQSAGGSIELASAAVRGRRLEIIGHTVFEAPVEQLAAAHTSALEHARAGRLQVDIETHSLDRVADAWEELRAGPHHKLVVTP